MAIETDTLRGRAIVAGTSLLLFAMGMANAQTFGPPSVMSNTIPISDLGDDQRPHLATDGAGNWVAVWESTDTLNGTIGTDLDILAARSTDNGATWTLPVALNSYAASDSGLDTDAAVSTDGVGTWIAVWHAQGALGGSIGTDFDVLVASSTDNGATWTPAAALNSNAASDAGDDFFPQIESDGAGHWVAVWRSNDALGGTIGTDLDILAASSSDNGATWTAPVALNSNAASDSGSDQSPQIASDGAGNWVAVWQSTDSLGGTIGTDTDILVARSTDNGMTWTAPAALNSTAPGSVGGDDFPQVDTDNAGNWVAVWRSGDSLGGTIGNDADILVARSTDNGATWTATTVLNSNAASDSGFDEAPHLSSGGGGSWVAVWQSTDSLGGTIGTDPDILVAHSTDNGMTWSPPTALNTDASSESGNDQAPHVRNDGVGTWVTVWHSNNTVPGALGLDYDILGARSIDGGASWTAPAPANSNAPADNGSDEYPDMATDGAGNWVAVWQSDDSLGGTNGFDQDILVSSSNDDGASWSAPAALNSNAPISADHARPDVATDRNGNWVAVWYAGANIGSTFGIDGDIFVARSTDNGATWTAITPLNADAATDSAGDLFPQVSTDGDGHWVAVWHSGRTLGGTIGPDYDIMVARSTDHGSTWTEPAALNSNAASDGSHPDQFAYVSTDGAGTWVAVWSLSDSLGPSFTESHIMVARSTDNGATWSPQSTLSSGGMPDLGLDRSPRAYNDTAGNWVVVWQSTDSLGGTIGSDSDILMSRSSDNGITWTAPAPLNANAATDSGDDQLPYVTTDGAGNWAAVWQSTDTLDGTIGTDLDILMASSSDNGATWSTPIAHNTNADVDLGDDEAPQLNPDGAGHWVAVWFSDDTLGGQASWEVPDIFYATARICGDGFLAGSEACDDGNTIAGDGCDSSCQIEQGYECPTVGEPCSDIDGCDPDLCLNGGVCNDVPAPGTGSTCDCTGTGYTGAFCAVDVDECALEIHNCDVNATCTNSIGAFNCSCNAGYSGSGVTCVDTDGCDPNPCGNGGVCMDVSAPGTGANCDCSGTGYSGAVCETDIDECTLATDNCDVNASCANTPGSFTCTCNANYGGDGVTCTYLGPDHYVAYKINAPRENALGIQIPENIFPKGWVVTINDTILEGFDPGAVDNPENFIVKKERSLLLPAQKGDEDSPDLDGRHYLRYQAAPGTESVQPALNGDFSRPPRHVSRVWQLDNQFGGIKVRSKKVTALLVPANKSLSAPPAPPADVTHYVCYQVSAVQNEHTDQTPGVCASSALANANGPCLDDAACGGGSGQFTLCSEPRFRRDLQAFFLDQFADCALNDEGGVSFLGAAAQGMCLFDLTKVKELCNPIDKTPVEAPRETTAVIAGSTAMSTPSLLCYQPRLALRFRNATTAALASVPMQAPVGIDDSIDPRQSKHVRHRVEDGNAVYTAPGNLFPAPLVVNTSKQGLVCIPTVVLAVSNATP